MSKTLRYPYHNNCHDIMLFNCCKNVVKTSCGCKVLKFSNSKYLYWNTLKSLCLKRSKFWKLNFHLIASKMMHFQSNH